MELENIDQNKSSQFSVINLNENNKNNSVADAVLSTQEHINEGFVNDEVDNASNFQRNRPGTTTSIRSTASTSSRSSVNCQSGIIRCPNLRLQKFFSYKEGGLEKCFNDIKPAIMENIDGNVLGKWLLIEIDHWDLHREKVIVLTDKSLIIVTYDFITNTLKFYKRISLAEITEINYGNLKYPNSSMMGQYQYGAVKLRWGDDPNFIDKWNPFSKNIPFIIFTSHHIIYNEKEHETATYNCDDFIQTLELAISKLSVAKKPEFKEGPIEIQSYASLVSVMYNQNWLGFQLDRNGMKF